MNMIVSTIDITETRKNWAAGEFKPALVIPHKKDNWRVLDAPHTPGVAPVWAVVDSDTYIRIPLFQYQLSPHADFALAFMLQLGLSFVGYLPYKIKTLHIVTGDPVELVYDENKQLSHMICWIGFAVVDEQEMKNG